MAKIWRNSVHLCIEVSLLYFFIVLSYMHTSMLPPIVGLIVPTLVTIIIYSVISANLQVQTLVLIVFIAPLIAMISFFLGYGYVLSFVIGGFLSWRGFVLFVQDRPLTARTIFLLCFFWMLPIYVYIYVSRYVYAEYFIYLFGIQLLLFLLAQSGESVIRTWRDRTLNKKVVVSSLSFISVILGLTVFLSTIGKWIISIGLKAFGGVIGFVFGILSKPFFYLASLLEFNLVLRGEEAESIMEGEGGAEEKEIEQIVDVAPIWDNILVMVILIVLLFIIAFFLLRKVKVMKSSIEVAATYNGVLKKIQSSGRRGWWQKPPENEVRKLVFELEKLAHKKNRARYPNETLEEWLVRESVVSEHFFSIYEKVRYGEMELTEEEVARCKQLATEIRSIMRKWKKY
ncbi:MULTISPECIES: DUF4129 domain-containing protein [Sutcliffiella]|uniref:DUF4129 domain-containing protein n=1 Tax=Sutcliffiella cohnii TaxID=33932 RepID=A0A223KQ43_9BACI|nr:MULTISPECIES: DUF4129 domain-containing protein [Sutcliffiella]AST91474.1 hypothetical protein BC6307_09370 [Sutcliffiella cohnii]MED4014961.1 DUF4129 domain-containing protein [Sutcliffiella cohnii]WBL17306.1 DUF4129 domain-containing protein [Sutcliffiella sp. NC1]